MSRAQKGVGEFLDIETVRVMNRELKSFLEHSLTTDAFWEKWTADNVPTVGLRCWEIKNCKHTECPAYLNADTRCWLKAGTLCEGKIQGDFANKFESCFSCEVLGRIESDAVRSLYEHINILIHHLKNRDAKIVSCAITDQLTGVYNRLYFNEYMSKRLAQAERSEEQLSLIMIDLDGFKGLNDTHGHRAGDEVLVETADLLLRVVRNSDLVFRYGGDEFLVVLAQVECDKAQLVKQRISRAVEQWNLEKNRYDQFRLSLSLGCSGWNKGDDLLTRIDEADAQMYHEKRMKREGERRLQPQARQLGHN